MYRLIRISLIFVGFFAASCGNYYQQESVMIAEDGIATFSISNADSDAAEPAVAADAEGNVYVLYVEHNPDKTADLYIQKRTARTLALPESSIRINPVKGSVKAWRGDPPTIAIGPNGTIHTGWNLKRDDGGKAANDLVLSVSSDGGKTFAPPVKVNDDTAPASHGMHSLLVDGERVYMSWLDERNIKPGPAHSDEEPNSEVYFSVSTDGGRTFSANKKLAPEICPCCKVSMAAGSDGRLYVSWRQVLPGGYRHIAVASSADKGANFSPGVIVSDDKWQIEACPVSGSSLSVEPDGRLSVFWYSAGEAGPAGIYSTSSPDAGKTFGPRQMVSDAAVSGTPASIAAADGKASCVFAAKENSVVFRTGPLSGTGTGKSLALPDSALPAAAVGKANAFIAFVRATGEKRSVWLAAVPL